MTTKAHISFQPVSGGAKFGYGIFLPVVFFVACQILLILSLDSGGGWDGIGLAFGSLVIVPALLIANCWVLFIVWRRRSTVILAGTMLPAGIGAMEFLLVHGPFRIRWAVNAAFVAPFTWLWLFAALVFAPLAFFMLRPVRGRQRRS
jgi:hypothetical protein